MAPSSLAFSRSGSARRAGKRRRLVPARGFDPGHLDVLALDRLALDLGRVAIGTGELALPALDVRVDRPGPAGKGENDQFGREIIPFNRLDLQLGLAHRRLERHRFPRFRRLEAEAAGFDRLLGIIGPQGEGQSGQAGEDCVSLVSAAVRVSHVL